MSSSGSKKWLVFIVIWLLIFGGGAVAYKYFLATDGTINGNQLPDPVKGLQVPFILWGGDVATFHANGGLETKPDTVFARQGLKIKLVRGDDFDKQVKDYLEGKSPFLRGTMSMLGQASEQIAKDSKTQPVVFLQLTWSRGGDHLVGRADFKNLNDLKGKKIALQKGGPHVGMLNDILHTAKVRWSDITVVWTEDVTGEKGPEARFRNDSSIDGCFVVTPDMLKLTGGAEIVGTGVKGTIEGAHVVVSTKTMSRSIADVYACRKDFFDAHQDVVAKFAAGYLKACEELENLKARQSARYREILDLTQSIYGKDDIPDEAAAEGLVADAHFVDLPGNVAFFTRKENVSNFEAKQMAALDLAIDLKDARAHYPFLKPDAAFYEKLKKLGGLARDPDEEQVKMNPGYKLPAAQKLQKNTLFSFEINFLPDQIEFPAEQYGEQFQRAVEQSALFGKGVIAVRGHTDLAMLLTKFVKEGMDWNVIRRTGTAPDYQYYVIDGDVRFKLSDTHKIVALIRQHQDKLQESNKLLDSCVKLSADRAQEARNAVLEYAKLRNLDLDPNQIVAVGVGVVEAVAPVPRSVEEMAQNRRVEFRIIRVSSTEAVTTKGADY